tara:strand:+ start:1859 stop:2269 length:411 start_codon:yes stop_codon:yes gene_type:complete
MKDTLKVEKFSSIILLGYLTMIIKSVLLGTVAWAYNKPDIMGVLFLGTATPILFSLWNCVVISYLARKNKDKLFAFNMLQFLPKLTFMGFMTYAGITWFSLPPLAYMFTLCGTWFMFHVIEAFYTQQLLLENLTGE